ncbi:glycoside hydrolase family 16 protein [Agrobacterium tumefaciens]|uniref:glycoside hydrolase family 16 protein n=1 Tax=Agrobacterium tumefaciens TaxID=358 RepID=UPI003BA2695D
MTRLVLIFFLLSTALANGSSDFLWPSTNRAGFSGDIRLTSGDQPYASRRAVTEEDRQRIKLYRSTNIRPVYQTAFTEPTDLLGWELLSEEKIGALSCRRPESVSTTSTGLWMEFKLNDTCEQTFSSGGIISKDRYGFGYFEVSMRIASIPAVDNAFWLTTGDHYEIDVVESFYPSTATSALHQWAPPPGSTKSAVSTAVKTKVDLSKDFHDYGVLWTPKEMVFAVDGEPYVALKTEGYAKQKAAVRLTNILVPWSGKLPNDVRGNGTIFRGLRIFQLQD